MRDVVLCTGAGAQPPPSSARPCAVACDAHDPAPRRGAAPLPRLGRHADAAALRLGDGDRPAARCADTYVPGPPHCTHGLRVPACCVLYGPEAQGSLPRGATHCTHRRTRTSLGRAARTAYRVVHPRWALGVLCFECLTDGLPFPFAEDDATQVLESNPNPDPNPNPNPNPDPNPNQSPAHVLGCIARRVHTYKMAEQLSAAAADFVGGMLQTDERRRWEAAL